MEAEKLEGLLADTRAYRQAPDIRAFVVSVLRDGEATKRDADVRTWADWALEIADRRDRLNRHLCPRRGSD